MESTGAGYASMASQLGSVQNTFSEGYMNYVMAKHNAAMAAFEMKWTDIKVGKELEALRDEEARILGNNRAVHGGSGFSVASKTNVDIERDVILSIGKDAAIIRTRGGIEKMRSSIKEDAANAEARGVIGKTTITALSQGSSISRSKGFETLFKSKKRLKLWQQ